MHPRFERSLLHPRFWLTWFFLFLLRIMVWLPLPVQHAVGHILGTVFYHVNGKRRRIAGININTCFPELTEPERERLLKQHFKAYGASIFDLAVSWWASRSRLERLTSVHGMHHYQQALDNKQNVILLTGHMLTVDLCGRFISHYRPGVSMMKPLKNPLINWLVYRGRRHGGNIMVYREQGLRPMVRYLRNDYTAYIMPDEDFGSPASVFAPFFTMQSWTVTSLSVLARLGDAVVIPVAMCSKFGGKGYDLHLLPPLDNFPSGDDVEDATKMNQALEELIRKMPEMYAWTFKLFKTRPQGEDELY